MSLIVPRPNPTSQPYWDGCRAGVLRLQRCDDCAGFQFYPRIFCSHCGGSALSWRDASGAGTIASFTVVRRAVAPGYTAPYVVALVDLDEGPRMMSALIEVEPEQLHVGDPVTVDFLAWSEEISLPVFRLKQGGT